jgi:hypothetical protein
MHSRTAVTPEFDHEQGFQTGVTQWWMVSQSLAIVGIGTKPCIDQPSKLVDV